MLGSDFPEFIDRYRVKDRLGKGGQGVVYLAHDPNLDIDVAVKVLSSDNPDFVERFKLDARVLARLNAPNIVRIFDFNPNYPYLVMEHCREGDLNDLIKLRRPQPLTRIVALVRQIAEALIVAHEQPEPILHRDLKPGNVLFDKKVAKVTDFGLAKVLGDQTGGMTMSHGMMGTAGYASPEQLQDASKVDHRTDLWAVGVILYELMTFRGPFESADDDNVFQTAMRVVQSPPAKPDYALPRPIWELIERSLRKSRDQRFASARELVQALDTALASVSEAERNASYPPAQALGELDRLASKTADSIDAGNLDAARECVKEMKSLSKEASVTRYWVRRLHDRDGTGRPVSASTSAPTSSGSLASIDKLTSQNRFADARRECGKLLVADPENQAVHERLLRITTEERELNEGLKRATDEATAARAQDDLERVVAIWTALDRKHPDHPDISAELSGAVAERNRQRQEADRNKAQAAAASREQAGDLAGALAILDAYLKSHPQDEALSQSRARIKAIHAAQFLQERVRQLRDAARSAPSDDPEVAIAAWQALLEELPTDEEAHRETERIRRAASARKLARAIEAAESRAEPYLSRHAYDSALAVWRELQQIHPGDDGIRTRIADLERQGRDFQKRSLVETVGVQADRLAAASESGRYEKCSGLPERIGELVRNARIALRGDVDALTAAAAQLAEAKETAEAELVNRRQSFRAQLLQLLHEAIDLVPNEPTTTAEGELRSAVELVTRTLCGAEGPEADGDPLLALDCAATSIETAIDGVATERRVETDRARTRSAAAIEAAEQALQRLAISPAANTESGRDLAHQMEQLRERSGSRSADVLEQLVAVATELAHRAVDARVRSEWARLQQIREALDEARALVAAGATGQIAERAGACVKLLTEKPASIPSERLDQALAALTQENAKQRKTLDEVESGATRVWQQAEQRSRTLGGAVSRELRSRIDASLLAGKPLTGKALDREARRLGALVGRAEIESVWAVQSGTFRALEGSAGGIRETGSEVRKLVAEYRAAAARGDGTRMRALGAHIGKESGSTREVATEAPQIGSRMRRLNQRLLPAQLKAYDDSSTPSEAAQAYRTLLHPAPAWRRWASVAAVVAVVAAVATVVTLAMPRSGPTTVRLVSPSGTVLIRGVQKDGSPFTIPSTADKSVGPQGTTWTIDTGEYRVTTEYGVTIQFNLPGDETVLVPGAPLDHTSELADRLGLSELLATDE